MRILIVNPFGIGDVLFTTPVISNIKNHMPDADIAYICNRRTAPLLEHDTRIYKIFVYEKDELRSLWQQSKFISIRELYRLFLSIKKENFDCVLDFSLAGEFGFFFWLAGIKTRIGFDYKNRARFLNKKIKVGSFKDKHIIEHYLELLKFLNIPVKEKNISIFTPRDEQDIAKALLKSNNISQQDNVIAVIPGGGASWGKDSYRKRYPAVKFAEVCDRLIKECSGKVIILGDKNEETIINDVVSSMEGKPSLVLTNLPLKKVVAVLSLCRLVYCNDSGPLHIAVGLGVKTVSVFGPVDEKVYGPYPPDERHKVITAGVDCRPCYKNFKVPECGNIRCLEELRVDEIINACKKQLELK